MDDDERDWRRLMMDFENERLFKRCPACGAPYKIGDKDNRPTTECPGCGKMRCELCDMGAGTVCPECEEND